MSDAASSSTITVRQQWIVIGIFAAIVIVAEYISIQKEPLDYVRGDRNGFSLFSGLVSWLGHAIWLSMDRRRRGLEMGRWRYAVVFLGPVAIWIYLILEYRVRALYLIPLSLAIYGGIAVLLLGLIQITGV